MLTVNKHQNLKKDIFEQHPKIILVRKFSEVALEEFTKAFLEAESTGQEIIPIQVDSLGGSVDALLGMLDIIERSKKTICTFTNTKAYSCGAVLLACGSKGFRFASKNSSVLVHEISSATYGKQNDMSNDLFFLEMLNEKLLTILDKACGQEKGFFKQELHENGNADMYYIPAEARKVGLIDKIKSPCFEIEVSQKFKLI